MAGSGTYAIVPQATVSRRHAAVGESIGSIPTLIDRGGRNGTFLDGRPVGGSVALLRHSIVRFGDVLAVVDERGVARAVRRNVTSVAGGAKLPSGAVDERR